MSSSRRRNRGRANSAQASLRAATLSQVAASVVEVSHDVTHSSSDDRSISNNTDNSASATQQVDDDSTNTNHRSNNRNNVITTEVRVGSDTSDQSMRRIQSHSVFSNNNNNNNILSTSRSSSTLFNKYLSEETIAEKESTSKDNSLLCSKNGEGARFFSSFWEEVTQQQLTPGPRSLHSGAILGDDFYIFAGYDGFSRVSSLYKFNFKSEEWSLVCPASSSEGDDRSTVLLPAARDRHTCVVYRNFIVVFAGFNGTQRVNDLWAFDLNRGVWEEIRPLNGSPPTPRHSHAAVTYDNSMFICCGYDGSYRNDVHEFNFRTKSWVHVETRGRTPRSRYRSTCVTHRDSMILSFGHDGTTHLSDIHIFDFPTSTWSSLLTTTGTPPSPRDSHLAVIHNDAMYVFGGSSGVAMNDLYQLQFFYDDFDAVPTWTELKSVKNLPEPRFCHVGVVYRDSIYVYGGYNGNLRLDDFISFDLAIEDLSSQIPKSTLHSDLSSLVDNDKFSDVTFLVENKHVKAHKVMLARHSYFETMLLGGMKESRESTIHIVDVRHEIFLLVLQYLYTDDVDVPLDLAIELFVAADQFCLDRLKKICENKMLASITIQNAAAIFYAADLHHAEILKSKVLKYMIAHFEQVSKTESFEEMTRMNVDLVFEVLHNR